MATIDWTDTEDTLGQPTREFRIKQDMRRDLTGAVWLPKTPASNGVLACFGHGASGTRYQTPIAYLAGRFVNELNIPALSIDGPVHGLRKVGDGARGAFGEEFRREESVQDMLKDWTVALDQVKALDEIAADKLVYFGLSMGSIYGVPLVGARDDVIGSVLGLLSYSDKFPHMDEVKTGAENITSPVRFLMQLEDELMPRDGYLALFDLLASNDKSLHANPGLHPDVPQEEVDASFEFLVSCIEGRNQTKTVNIISD